MKELVTNNINQQNIIVSTQSNLFNLCFVTPISNKKTYKLVILGNLGMPRHSLNDSINLKKCLMFICKQKTNFVLSIFFEILQRHCKFVILSTLDKPAYTHPK